MIAAISITMLTISLLFGFLRLIKGPSALDRILAFDTIAVSMIGLLITFSVEQKLDYFLEIILIFCLLGFVTTVAIIDYLFRTNEAYDELD